MERDTDRPSSKHRKTLVKEGILRILDTSSKGWQVATVKLYSNAELEWRLETISMLSTIVYPQLRRKRIKPSESAVLAPEAPYPGVFSIKKILYHGNNYSSDVIYLASKDPMEAERWMHLINYTQLLHVTELINDHTLIPREVEDVNQVVNPTDQMDYSVNGSTMTLECDCCGANISLSDVNKSQQIKLVICKECEAELRFTPIVQLAHSSNHTQHLLVHLSSIHDPSWYPTDFSTFICGVCQVPSNGPLYHCVECGDYDECPNCFRPIAMETATVLQESNQNINSESSLHDSSIEQSWLEQLPAEITIKIISFVPQSHQQAARLFKISKTITSLAGSNDIWKPLFLQKWPTQNSKLKIKSWRTLYKRRLETVRRVNYELEFSHDTHYTGSPQFIENCDVEMCPVIIEDLTNQKCDDRGNPICFKCDKTVYKVTDIEQFMEMGRCVSLLPQRPKLTTPLVPQPARRIIYRQIPHPFDPPNKLWRVKK